jgi:hypothetical protein
MDPSSVQYRLYCVTYFILEVKLIRSEVRPIKIESLDIFVSRERIPEDQDRLLHVLRANLCHVYYLS